MEPIRHHGVKVHRALLYSTFGTVGLVFVLGRLQLFRELLPCLGTPREQGKACRIIWTRALPIGPEVVPFWDYLIGF